MNGATPTEAPKAATKSPTRFIPSGVPYFTATGGGSSRFKLAAPAPRTRGVVGCPSRPLVRSQSLAGIVGFQRLHKPHSLVLFLVASEYVVGYEHTQENPVVRCMHESTRVRSTYI